MLKRMIEAVTTVDEGTAWSGNVFWTYVPPVVALSFIAYVVFISVHWHS